MVCRQERARLTACGCLVSALACAPPKAPPDTARSGGLVEASLSIDQQVAVWQGAIRAAFDVGPELYLVTTPARLPDGAGLEGGEALPAGLGAALVRVGAVQASCTPLREGPNRAPRCSAPRSGYIVRATKIYQAGGDTVRMNFRSELFAAASGTGQQPFAFEMAYKLIPSGGGRWRVAAEGRVKE